MTLQELLQMSQAQRRQAAGPTASGEYTFDIWSGQVRPKSRVVGQNHPGMFGNEMAYLRRLNRERNQPAPMELAPIERHPFPIGDWGGMQRAVGYQQQLDRRPNFGAMGGAAGSPFGGQGMSGGPGVTLGSLLSRFGGLGGGGY